MRVGGTRRCSSRDVESGYECCALLGRRLPKRGRTCFPSRMGPSADPTQGSGGLPSRTGILVLDAPGVFRCRRGRERVVPRRDLVARRDADRVHALPWRHARLSYRSRSGKGHAAPPARRPPTAACNLGRPAARPGLATVSVRARSAYLYRRPGQPYLSGRRVLPNRPSPRPRPFRRGVRAHRDGAVEMDARRRLRITALGIACGFAVAVAANGLRLPA